MLSVSCICAKGRWSPDCPVHPSNVLPFPRHGPGAQVRRVFNASGDPLSPLALAASTHRCEGYVHVYGELPGRCQCGENFWDGTTSA